MQWIERIAKELQGARDSIHWNGSEVDRIKDNLVWLKTESDELTAEIQAVYPKVNLEFAYNPGTIDLVQAGYEHD